MGIGALSATSRASLNLPADAMGSAPSGSPLGSSISSSGVGEEGAPAAVRVEDIDQDSLAARVADKVQKTPHTPAHYYQSTRVRAAATRHVLRCGCEKHAGLCKDPTLIPVVPLALM